MTNGDRFKEDFYLKRQMQRAAVSIPSNIAEGDERRSEKEGIRFLFIAKGSLAELDTQIEIAFNIGYIDRETLAFLNRKIETIRKMLSGLIQTKRKREMAEDGIEKYCVENLVPGTRYLEPEGPINRE